MQFKDADGKEAAPRASFRAGYGVSENRGAVFGVPARGFSIWGIKGAILGNAPNPLADRPLIHSKDYPIHCTPLVLSREWGNQVPYKTP